jgi:cysteine-rich repeat protein
MRGSVRLSFELGACVLAVALVVSGCNGTRRRGPGVPSDDGGAVDSNVPHEDLGLPVDAYVPPVPVCGDWTIDEGEQCDDGNRTSGDGCDAYCQLETPASCGDYTVQSGEDCDAGPSGSSSCTPLCTYVTCGDGILTASAGETCDDGDSLSGDGCSSYCNVETGWTCSGAPSYCTATTVAPIDRSASPALAILDSPAAAVTSTISITGSAASACMISALTVDVDISHTYIGDLTVTLTSPAGTPVILHNRAGTSGVNIVGTYPIAPLTPYGLLSDFSGEVAAGTWSLSIADGASGDTGTLNTWGLHITCAAAF